jgi:hypothetical protein
LKKIWSPATRDAAADDDELWQQHLRRFKVFAEASHREAGQRRRGRNAHGNDETPNAGAGGWMSATPRLPLTEEGGLF